MRSVVRGGPAHWARGYVAMLQWETINLPRVLPGQFVVQVLIGAGFAVGIGLLRDLSTREAMFLASGTAVVTAVLSGLIIGPRLIIMQKAAGTYDFLQSLPVPRSAGAAVWLTVTVLVGLPGMAAAVAITAWHYDVAVQVGWEAVPAIGLSSVTAAAAGYTLAHAIGNPMLTRTVAQALLFLLLGFTPVNFPSQRLPLWLDQLHDWLPFEPMAIVTRAALTPQLAGDVGRAYLTLIAWLAGLLAVAGAVVGRRR